MWWIQPSRVEGLASFVNSQAFGREMSKIVSRLKPFFRRHGHFCYLQIYLIHRHQGQWLAQARCQVYFPTANYSKSSVRTLLRRVGPIAHCSSSHATPTGDKQQITKTRATAMRNKLVTLAGNKQARKHPSQWRFSQAAFYQTWIDQCSSNVATGAACGYTHV